MTNLRRFGRKINLPSTRQIRHELLTRMLEEERSKAAKALSEGAAAIGSEASRTPN